MKSRLLAGVGFGMLLLFTSTARADEDRKQEASAQGMGFFTTDSTGNGRTQKSTDTGGFLLSYRYHFNRWLAADASYGYARNPQQNFTSSGPLSVQANVHQATGALVVAAPHRLFRRSPYRLAGARTLVLDPTANRR